MLFCSLQYLSLNAAMYGMDQHADSFREPLGERSEESNSLLPHLPQLLELPFHVVVGQRSETAVDVGILGAAGVYARRSGHIPHDAMGRRCSQHWRQNGEQNCRVARLGRIPRYSQDFL